VVNRCLENYLRCFAGDKPKEWTRWLPWAEWWYNTTCHSATKMIPFEAVYGLPPPIVDQVDRFLQDRTQILRLLKDNLTTTQSRMKHQADKHRSEREFSIGDWVFLHLQPYCQISIQVRSSMKRIGPVAYRLDLSPDSKIHPVFHVSCLKKKLGEHVFPQHHLPDITSTGNIRAQPSTILDFRLVKRHNRAAVDVLVLWARLPQEDATWEPYETFRERFPAFVDSQP